MSELIRRSDAIAIIQNAKYKFPTWPHIAEAKEDMVQAIKSAPTIDAVPVVRGEWTSLTECSNEGVYCSVCHKKVWKADYAICTKTNKIRSNYCPNCGAHMTRREV